ncbi:MAG: outer membrane lipoprotein carrier protein LolA [Bosea sp.]|uniref:outer membrane lipoprotein carrier protein LolA n=1 Tax=Bosea sp. (in: a-proteobacteria) TaxID=1871050 RepID=UPI001AC66DEA|nr:outer membrane lipoprotein carrier protein LolA [Bosea sp. (in: a-proteobacteria)]MBN9454839.1 outer membrane lipoprotein carrier protein LolA [Bosea sp. (in: a-proteobacteria)]
MLDRLTPAIQASVLLATFVGCAFAAGPLAAQPLQLQPPKPAATKPAAPHLVLPPPRPAGLGEARSATTETSPAQAVATNAPAATAPAAEAAKPAASARSKQPPPATQEEAVERLNAYLNSFQTLQGNFIQHASNGRRLEGRIYIQRPGKMRFEYEPPTTTEVIADGTSVAIRDKRLATQDLYSIGQTPLKFLVREKMDLAREGTLKGASIDGDLLTVRLEDRSTLGGTSKITLKFDLVANELRQWVVVDPQGYETAISLYNLDTRRRPDPQNFVIDYQRRL